MSSFESRRFRLTIALGVGLTLLCCVVDQLGWLSVLDNWFYDIRALECQTFTPKPTDRIVHVDIDDAALDPGAVGRWPWPRGTLARIIDEIGRAKPAALGMDIRLSEPTQKYDDDDSTSVPDKAPDEDALLEQSLARQKNLVLVLSALLPPADIKTPQQKTAFALLHGDPEMTFDTFARSMRLRGIQVENRDELRDLYTHSRIAAVRDLVAEQLARAPQTDAQLMVRLLPHTDPTIRSPLTNLLEKEASAFRAKREFNRFGFDVPRLTLPVVPGELTWIPLQQFSRPAVFCGFADYEYFPGSVLRSVPLFVEVDHRLYPQFGLVFGCTLLGADIRHARIESDQVVIPRAGGGELRIPTHRFHSQTLNRDFSTIADIPWFGGRNWQTMYDWPNYQRQVNHLSVNLVWEICDTLEKIKKNNRIFDAAIADVFAREPLRLDPEFAQRYAASVHSEEDTQSREKAAATAIAKLKESQYIEVFSAIPVNERKRDEQDELDRLLAGRRAFDVGDLNRGLSRQLSDLRATLADRLGGKGVLLGWTAENVEGVDNVTTSLHTRCPGIVVHGVIAEAVLGGRWPTWAPEWIGIALVLALGFATSFFVARFQPIRGFAATLFLIVGYLLFNGYVLFGLAALIVPVAGSVLTISIVWSGCTLQRVIFEGIERNRVATEVAIINREMDLAHQVQAALIPKQPPHIEGLDADGWTQPASTTGGDCYDLWKLNDGRLAILVADASGHGLAPAMIVSQVRTLVRALSEVESNPTALLRRVNARIAEDVESNRFVTAFLGFLSPGGLLEYASAGHGPQFCYECTGVDAEDMQVMDSTGPPLGIDPVWYCDDPVPPVQLPPGGTLIVLSDGIFEAMAPNKDQFGLERLQDILHCARDQSGKVTIQRIVKCIEDWQNKQPPADDQTVVIARRVAASDGNGAANKALASSDRQGED